MDFKALVASRGFLISGNATKGFFVYLPKRGDFKKIYAIACSFGGLTVSRNARVFPQLVTINELS